MVKKIFLVFSMALSGFISADGLNAINDPVMNPCIQRPDLAGCGANGSSASRRVINIPNRWGAIYYNPANRAFGYSDNNTKSSGSAEKEALTSCIKAGGGQNPIASDGKGCRLVTRNRNSCSAIAMGKNEGYAIKSGSRLDELEQEVLKACSKFSDSCEIRYSGCSRHPDYLRY